MGWTPPRRSEPSTRSNCGRASATSSRGRGDARLGFVLTQPGAASRVLPGIRQPRHQQRIRRSRRRGRLRPTSSARCPSGTSPCRGSTGRATSACRPRPSARSSTIRARGRSKRRATSTSSTDATSPAAGTSSSQVYLDRYLYDGDYVFDQSTGTTPLPVVNKDLARGDRWGSELRAHEAVRQPAHARLRRRVAPQLPSESSQLRRRTVPAALRRSSVVGELGRLCAGRIAGWRPAPAQSGACGTISTTRLAAPPTRASPPSTPRRTRRH